MSVLVGPIMSISPYLRSAMVWFPLRVSRGPHNFCLGLALVELVKTLG